MLGAEGRDIESLRYLRRCCSEGSSNASLSKPARKMTKLCFSFVRVSEILTKTLEFQAIFDASFTGLFRKSDVICYGLVGPYSY